MTAFYSEFDPKAAAWLRELIKQGHIADGVVDERDLWDVAPDDLRGFTQVHLCAGIGVWSYALRRAGWPDNRPCWTGSFPCQPFSAAGKGAGFADERHLWPAGQYLIEQCRPRTLFGEQVASKDAEPWLDAVQADLEAMGYAFGACAFPSASIGAPHIRDRLYWVADAAGGRERAGRECGELVGLDMGNPSRGDEGEARQRERLWADAGAGGDPIGVADPISQRGRRGQPRREDAADARLTGETGGMAITDGGHPGAERQQRGGEQRQQPQDGGVGNVGNATSERAAHERLGDGEAGERQTQQFGAIVRAASRIGDGAVATRGERDAAGRVGSAGLEHGTDAAGPTNGLWRDADWLLCRDGKWRPVEPGTFPLAHGAPARVGRLRGYGNAINAEAAVAWIESYLEAIGERAFISDGAEEASAVRT